MGRKLKVLFASAILVLTMGNLFSKTVEQHEQIDLDGIEEVVIELKTLKRVSFGFNFVGVDTAITSCSGDEMLADLELDVTAISEKTLPEMEVERSSKMVKILFNIKNKVGVDLIRFGKIKVAFALPSSYHGKVKVESSVYNISAEDLSVSELYIQNKTGNIDLYMIEADTLMVRNSTGNIDADLVKANVGKIRNSSGNIRCGELIVDDLSLKNSTGNVAVENIQAKHSEIVNRCGSVKIGMIRGGAKISSSLGNIKARFEEFTDDVSVSNKTGSVKLYLPRDSAFAYTYKNGCGSVKFDFPRTESIDEESSRKIHNGTVNGGGPLLDAKVSTGSLKIYAY